jgi:hypothetical protein
VSQPTLFPPPNAQQPSWLALYDEWMHAFMTAVNAKMVNFLTTTALPNLQNWLTQLVSDGSILQAEMNDFVTFINTHPAQFTRQLPLRADYFNLPAHWCLEVPWSPRYGNAVVVKRDGSTANVTSSGCTCPKDLVCNDPRCNIEAYSGNKTCTAFYYGCACQESTPETYLPLGNQVNNPYGQPPASTTKKTSTQKSAPTDTDPNCDGCFAGDFGNPAPLTGTNTIPVTVPASVPTTDPDCPGCFAGDF